MGTPEGYLQYTWRGGGGEIWQSFKLQTQKMHEPEILHPKKNNWHQNSLPPKNTRLKYLNTNLFNQTLRPKKVCDRSIDPKKYRGCKFSTQKNTSNPQSCILQEPSGFMTFKENCNAESMNQYKMQTSYQLQFVMADLVTRWPAVCISCWHSKFLWYLITRNICDKLISQFWVSHITWHLNFMILWKFCILSHLYFLVFERDTINIPRIGNAI